MIGHRFQRRLLACQGVTVAIALIGACSDPTSPASTSVSRPLMPLAVGTRWEYELYDSAGAGTVFTPVSTDTEAVVVAKDSIIAGEHFALLNGGADLLEEGGSSPVFVANRPDGLYEYRPPSGSVLLSTDAPILRFPYPTQRGAHFGLGGTWVVAATDTTITVPAGTFHCVRYDLPSGWPMSGRTAPDPGLTESYFIAPGVGVILRVFPQVRAVDGSGNPLGAMRLFMRLEHGPTAGTATAS